VQSIAKLIFLLSVCAAVGYMLEPLVFVHSEPNSSVAVADPVESGTPSQKLKVPKKVVFVEKTQPNRERVKSADPANSEGKVQTVKPPKKVSKEKALVLDDPVIDESKKVADFPIKSLQLERFDRQSITGSPALEKAIRYAIDNRRFEGLATLLEKEIVQSVSKQKEISAQELRELLKNPVWCHALNVDTMIHLLSSGELDQLVGANQRSGEFYYWIFTTPEALAQFLYNVKPQDHVRKAMLIWQDIWDSEKDAKIRDKYLNLAIACALVFDSGNITPKTDTAEIRSLPRYTLFRENAERKRLKTVLSKMEVADLVWVVDVPLTDSEIEWALRKANFSRRRWGRAYGHIEYLMERAVNGLNPYDEYSLAQIEKHGGICGDQTYFSVNTAKANGIPAAGVTGSGDRGGHAWLAYKPNKDEWDTTTGRYENYSNGTSRNAQTNQRISEFDFMLMSDRKMKSSRVMEAHTLLRFASVLELAGHDRVGIRQTFEEVLKIAPLLPKAWMAYIAFLEKEDPALTQVEWQSVIDTIERTFKKHPTMWLTARELTKKHIWKYLDDEQIAKTQSRYRSEIARKFPTRTDLIRDLIREQVETVNKQNDFQKMRSFYRQTLRLFGEDSLNFKLISQLYFNSGKKYSENRKQVCDDIESYFSRHVDTESGDFFKAKTEIGMLKMIANYYGEIGEDRKAAKYKKEADRRMKKGKRSAL